MDTEFWETTMWAMRKYQVNSILQLYYGVSVEYNEMKEERYQSVVESFMKDTLSRVLSK